VIRAIGVVVPAHNEEALLPDCLASLQQAAQRVATPVRLVVVADACTDQTVRRARETGVTVIEICSRNVGAARAAGMRAVLRQMPPADPPDVWLATTDADTLVPPDWLARQLSHADQGWDAVLGTVAVADWADWADRPRQAADAFAAHYGHGGGPHPHVHGANLGIRASAYLAAGGFPALRTAEDHALLRALNAAAIVAKRADDVTVQTSARRHARAPHGFSHLLGDLTAPA
jgi:glycosyltransferase involved in cell wall biosynthesis